MGQPVTVIQKPSSSYGRIRFEVNRPLSGMGHERYVKGDEVLGDRPVDLVAQRFLATGNVDAVHINGNVITVELAEHSEGEGLKEIVEDLFTYYRPGVEVPSFDA
ncbi:MAG: hypothetical protein GY929_02350 [Actinomycetia bacterium]|nr:hypothetical protein [Actinomycetes bacterium]